MKAFVQFSTEAYVSGKAIDAVSKVCGAAISQAKNLRTIEGAANMLGEQAIAEEVLQATQKIEEAIQESTTKALSSELINADTNVTKSVERISHKQTKNRPKMVDTRCMLEKNLEIAENAAKDAVRTEKLSDGRIRYYERETPSSKPGPTRGSSYVTEYDPNNGIVRSWYESYDHTGKINRVHPKMVNGKNIDSFHYPLTKKELKKIY